MAKTGAPIHDDKLSPLFGKIANIRATPDETTTRIRPALTEIQRQAVADWEPKKRDIEAGWNTLAGWKRYRWALCAWRKGVPTDPATGYPGWSGFALYTQCWRDQQTPAGHQPISPCSRRATDPDADPWDYTP